VTEQEMSDLWRLRTKWLGVYHVALVDDVWRAKRHHDVTTVITADTAEDLGQQIQADYATAGQTA
jgi:hypothetical protein